MLIECDTCAMRGPVCADCVVSVLLGAPAAAAGEQSALDGAEQAALAVLAGSGLVPPLRLVPVTAAPPVPERSGERGRAAAG